MHILPTVRLDWIEREKMFVSSESRNLIADDCLIKAFIRPLYTFLYRNVMKYLEINNYHHQQQQHFHFG